MSNLPSQELLETVHQFPGKFLFKVIGRTEDEFAVRVVTIVREVLSHESDPPFELRQTSGGRHVAITIEPWVESSEQVLLIYARIRETPGLVMLM